MSRSLRIDVYTTDRTVKYLLFDLSPQGQDQFPDDVKVALEDGTSIVYHHKVYDQGRAYHFVMPGLPPETFTLVVSLSATIAISVGTSLLSTWIWEKLKKSKNSTRIEIDRTEVELDEGEIKRVINEKIRVISG